MGFFRRIKARFTKPKASMSIILSKPKYTLGEDIEGILRLESKEEFEANVVDLGFNVIDGVYVEKEFTEREYDEEKEDWVEKRVRRWVWDDTTLHHEGKKLLEKKKIPARYHQDLKFCFKCASLTLPPTYKSRSKHTIWSIGAKTDVKGRPDLHTETEVQVVEPPTPPKVVKEIVKEVVMLPCAYCGSLMPQTSVFCPNCGARRK